MVKLVVITHEQNVCIFIAFIEILIDGEQSSKRHVITIPLIINKLQKSNRLMFHLTNIHKELRKDILTNIMLILYMLS